MSISLQNEFIIRQANNRDIASVKNVVFTVLREYNLKPDDAGKDKDLNDIEKNYFNNGGFFGALVNSSSNEIIGTFGLYRINNQVCELRKMYLLKEFRGRGLGKFMLTNAIGIAKEKNYEKIILETITPLKEAISLYKKYGFSEIKPAEVSGRVDQAYVLILS